MLRHQINSSSFSVFDISANLHFGIRYYFNKTDAELLDKYIKAGLTISKEINDYQPFLSYYRMYPEYRFGESENTKDYANSVIAFGLAIPYKNDLVIPEINYQFHGSDLSNGILFFGLGIRAFIKDNK